MQKTSHNNQGYQLFNRIFLGILAGHWPGSPRKHSAHLVSERLPPWLHFAPPPLSTSQVPLITGFNGIDLEVPIFLTADSGNYI